MYNFPSNQDQYGTVINPVFLDEGGESLADILREAIKDKGNKHA